uniref:Methyltransferase n=1 Tax=Thermosporothrix sp. COM3 TaxID=2490863 RepID=A0A455SKZ4_9CHLR|nr:methyltransferase [Thermosporothrix sp. COM3]
MEERGQRISAAPWDMFELLCGMWKTRAIATAVEFGIPDLVAEGPRTVSELATITGTHALSLYRLLRALASLGIFEEVPGEDVVEAKKFTHTEMSRYLCSGQKGTMYFMARAVAFPQSWKLWDYLSHSVRTGGSAWQLVEEEELWQYIYNNPEKYAVLEQFFSSLASLLTPALVQAYDFSHAQLVVDLGCGHGMLLSSLLQTYPHLKGICVDRPDVLTTTSCILASNIKEGRVQCIAADVRQEIPADADIYILQQVLHDMSNDDCIVVLKSCRQACKPESKLLIIECLPDTCAASSYGTFMDLQALLAVEGAGVRTVAEYSALAEAVGFSLVQTIPTASFLMILEMTACQAARQQD